MSFTNQLHYKPQWLHIIWTSQDFRPWIPKGKDSLLVRQIHKACRQQGIYLDLAAGHDQHIHLLVRPHTQKLAEQLRTLVSYQSRRFMYRHLPSDISSQITLVDWVKTIRHQELGVIRRHLLRQEKIHENMSFEEELQSLGMTQPNDTCVIWGDIYLVSA